MLEFCERTNDEEETHSHTISGISTVPRMPHNSCRDFSLVIFMFECNCKFLRLRYEADRFNSSMCSGLCWVGATLGIFLSRELTVCKITKTNRIHTHTCTFFSKLRVMHLCSNAFGTILHAISAHSSQAFSFVGLREEKETLNTPFHSSGQTNLRKNITHMEDVFKFTIFVRRNNNIT